jgi:hypothetical protein
MGHMAGTYEAIQRLQVSDTCIKPALSISLLERMCGQYGAWQMYGMPGADVYDA